MKIFLISAAAALLATSCSSFLDPQPQFKVSDKLAVVPQEFLFSKYEPLNEWLDTPVRALIQKVPLEQVFDEPAFHGLNYNLQDLPDSTEPVDIDALGLTRRQLLWAIAQDYKLSMVGKFEAFDGSSYIDIRGR